MRKKVEYHTSTSVEYRTLLRSTSFRICDYVSYVKGYKRCEDWFGVSFKQPDIETYDQKLKVPLSHRKKFIKAPPNLMTAIDRASRLCLLLTKEYHQESWFVILDSENFLWPDSSRIKFNMMNGVRKIYKRALANSNMQRCASKRPPVGGAFEMHHSVLTKVIGSLVCTPYLISSNDFSLISIEAEFVIRLTNHFSLDVVAKNSLAIKNAVETSKGLGFETKYYKN